MIGTPFVLIRGNSASELTLFYLVDLMVVKHLGGGKITLPTKNALLVGSEPIPLAHM